MRIVFMGTPDFAVPCLRRLYEDGHDIAAVISQPDKPKGRGYHLEPTPVKAEAERLGLPVYQPVKVRDGSLRDMIKELAPDVMVVVAYGRILPVDILNIPPKGCVNIHGSILPKYRGAAPIQWSVLSGDELAGVTSMYMAEGMDTGDIIYTHTTPIGESETSGELFDRLSAMGAECLSVTIKDIENGTAPRKPQNEAEATTAPMLNKEMSHIDFNLSAKELRAKINGLSPWPCAVMPLAAGKNLKILKVRLAEGKGKAGEILSAKPLTVACGEGALELITVQPEGKAKMEGSAFVNGARLKKGDMLF